MARGYQQVSPSSGSTCCATTSRSASRWVPRFEALQGSGPPHTAPVACPTGAADCCNCCARRLLLPSLLSACCHIVQLSHGAPPARQITCRFQKRMRASWST